MEEYPCANPSIDQLIEVIHNDVQRLGQVAYMNNSQLSKQKLPPLSTPPSLKVSTNGPLHEVFPTGTATALPAAVNPFDQGKPRSSDQKRVLCRFCGSSHNTFQCKISVEDRMSAGKSKQLCVNFLRGGHTTSQCQSQMFSVQATLSYYSSWSFSPSITSDTTDLPHSISQQTYRYWFREHGSP